MNINESKRDKSTLIEKWKPVLEDTRFAPLSESKKYTLSKMMENIESNCILSESTGLSDLGLTSSPDATNAYKPILIPMIRRIGPSLISMDIFGTQPISASNGVIAVLKSYYQNDRINPTKKNASRILKLTANYGGTSFPATVYLDPDGDHGSEFTAKVLYGEGKFVLVVPSSDELVNAATIVAGAQFGSVTETYTHTVERVYDNESLYHIIFKNYSKFTNSQVEALGETGSNTEIPQVGFNIETVSVETTNRVLKAQWSIELEQDLKNIWNYDAESLLKDLSTTEITAEMNREAIDLVHTNAILGGEKDWDYSAADGRWEIEKYQNLLAAISRASREIATSSRMGQGNYIIVSSNVYSALEVTGKLNTQNINFDNLLVNPFGGTLFGYMKVYVDMYATEDFILVGYKDQNSELKAGIFYAPYIALSIHKGYGENSGNPRLIFKTRYAYKEHPFGAQNYFRKINVLNLPMASWA